MLEFIASLRWQDIADIAFNSYILFRLYALFKGTQVLRIVAGIAILLAIQRVALALGLIVTSWVMQGVIAVGALIIIIVFRNEIRAVLQAKNLRAILWGIPRRSTQTPVEMIVDTVSELAKLRYGALLVFPGIEDITDLTRGGVPVDGRISQELLTSAFWPGNPVHDGAVIIDGDQIGAMGVMVPISTRRGLPSHFGSRHRAALGIAEKSDALVVAVSEERGKITVVTGDQFVEVSNLDHLTDLLNLHLGMDGAGPDGKHQDRLANMAAVALSVLIVTGVWFSFSRGLESYVTTETPIQFMNRSPEMELVETSADTVQLGLSGADGLIRAIRPGQVQIRVDLSKAVAGGNSFPINRDNIILPPGIEVKRMQPSTITVVLDTPIRKELPVQVNWVGKLPAGQLMTQANLSPATITVIGSHRLLDQKTTLYTEPVALEKIVRSGTILVRPALNPAQLRTAPGTPDRISVRMTVIADP